MLGYWAQNGAGPANGPANYEKPLLEVFRTTKYDILAVSFVIVFFDARNKGILSSQPRDKVAMLVVNTIESFLKECTSTEIRVSQNLARLAGEAHKMPGMEGGDNWSKLCSLGGRVSTLTLILEGEM